MPLLGRWYSWQACGGPDKYYVVSLHPWKFCGAPARPVVSLISRWCPWQACGAPGPKEGVMIHVPLLDPPLPVLQGTPLYDAIVSINKYQANHQ